MNNNFIAQRGEIKLTEKDLNAYIATLLRIENVGILLGAGSSVCAGGKTMKELWNNIDKESADWLKKEGYLENTNDIQTEFCANQIPEPPNVEELLSKLAISIHYLKHYSNSNQEGKLKSAEKSQQAIYQSIIEASKLDENMWKTETGSVSNGNANLENHRKMLQRLISARQPGQASPWVFTTNYDLSIEWAEESIGLNLINGFSGLHARKFTPQSFDLNYRNVKARGEAQYVTYNIYLSKLHGSLTWFEAEDKQIYEIQAIKAWEKLQNYLLSGNTHPPFLVMPGVAKYFDTVGFVLGELLRRFSEFVNKPQSTLIVSGYGFRDDHINRLLKTALINPTFQLIVYFPDFGLSPLPNALREILAFENPRVTIVGGRRFDGFVSHLPDPVIYNEDLSMIKEKLNNK